MEITSFVFVEATAVESLLSLEPYCISSNSSLDFSSRQDLFSSPDFKVALLNWLFPRERAVVV